MVDTPLIRHASAEDIPIIQALSYSIWPKAYAELLTPDQITYMLNWMYSSEVLADQMTQQGITYLLIEDEVPLGFAAFGPASDNRYKLHKLYVDSNKQQIGLGRQLLEKIWALLPPSCVGLELQVNKNNLAQYFYKKMGFIIESEAIFEIGNGYVMDDYIMWKPRM
jgi:ribosomal protein S18 acetylase RimI-like enzyme